MEKSSQIHTNAEPSTVLHAVQSTEVLTTRNDRGGDEGELASGVGGNNDSLFDLKQGGGSHNMSYLATDPTNNMSQDLALPKN